MVLLNIRRPVLSGIAAVCLLASCRTETPELPVRESEERTESGHLVSSTLVSSMQAEAILQGAVDNVAEMLEKCLGIGRTKEIGSFGTLLQNRLKNDFIGPDWQLKTYNILYTTKDARDNDIVLSADISFIENGSASEKSLLKTVSLCHMPFNIDDADSGILNTSRIIGEAVLPIRPFYGSLVVCPFYQGADYDKGKHRLPGVESYLKARQSIDAELAALEFLEGNGNVCMSEDYYTINAGVSNGGSTALAVQHLLEGDPDYVKAADKVRLGSTYAGEGCYDPYETITSALNNWPVYSLMYVFSPYAVLSVIIGTFDTWNGEFTSRGIQSPSEYFSSEMMGLTINYRGKDLNLIDYMNTGEMSVEFTWSPNNPFESNGLTLRAMMSPAVFLPSGKVDDDCILMEALRSAMSHNCFMQNLWSPASATKIVHSKADEFIAYEDALKAYESLGSKGSNPNVSMETLDGMEHAISSAYLLVRDLLCKDDPCR